MRKSKERRAIIVCGEYIHRGVVILQIKEWKDAGVPVYIGGAMQKKPVGQKFRRCQIFLAPDQVAFLGRQRKRLEVTQGYLVREALRQYAQGMGVKLAPEPEE